MRLRTRKRARRPKRHDICRGDEAKIFSKSEGFVLEAQNERAIDRQAVPRAFKWQ